MEVIEYKYGETLSSFRERLPFKSQGCVIALGFFDGVHIAHRALISRARNEADALSIPLVIFTFSGKNEDFKKSKERIYTDEEKCALLSECGADYTLLCDFPAISFFAKENFVSDFLIECVGAKCAVCGFNFHFGKMASGDAGDLSSLMESHGRRCIKIDEFISMGMTVSSTLIKKLIENRDIKSATELLGKPYFLSGNVSHGLGIGSGMGLPTVNTELPYGKFTPPRGVYATAVKIDGKFYPSLTNIGTCPTFGERPIHAETYILDFKNDVYNENIKIYFFDYIREERTFSSEKALIMQIKVDINKTKKILGDIKWQEIGPSLQ